MELLPIEQERLLVELAPHSCEIGYVAFRLGKLDSGDVWDEAGAIQSLKRAGLIEYEGERFEMSSVVEVAGQQVEQTLKLWDTFALTGDGVCSTCVTTSARGVLRGRESSLRLPVRSRR